jgi:hypothetical protein
MSNASRDENRIAALLAKSNSSNALIELLADAVTQRLLVNATITGNVQVAGLVTEDFDAVKLVQDATTDTWTFYDGGLDGELLATITITYTDATKETISTIVRT